MIKQCQGCGAPMHSDTPGTPGYLPPHILAKDGPAICQRCYRIRHYGQDEQGPVAAEQASTAVLDAIPWAEGIIMVVDLMDFEGSLSWDLIRSSVGKPLIAAVNKRDLLPKQVSDLEAVQWVRQRFRDLGVPATTALVSAAAGHGVADLVNYCERLGHKRWLVAGASNTGKSTLVNALLGETDQIQNATVSRFPGTTQNTVSWQHKRIGECKDSPGLVPPGRLCDMLSQVDAAKLIPAKALKGKVYPFPKDSAMAVKGCAAVVAMEGSTDAVAVGFTASDVTWERANAAKLDAWLESSGSEALDFHSVAVNVGAGHELVIHGLGSVAIRRAAVKLRLHKPRNVKFTVRPHLIGGKAYR